MCSKVLANETQVHYYCITRSLKLSTEQRRNTCKLSNHITNRHRAINKQKYKVVSESYALNSRSLIFSIYHVFSCNGFTKGWCRRKLLRIHGMCPTHETKIEPTPSVVMFILRFSHARCGYLKHLYTINFMGYLSVEAN